MQATDQLLDDEQMLDLALELFLQLAGDNLSAQAIDLFNQHFNQSGRLAIYPVTEQWLDNPIGFDLSQQAEFAEVVIGLVDEQENFTTQFAQLLLSRNRQAPLCHIRWLAN